MGKLVVDFKDYQPQQFDEYDGDEPRPGWYTFELQKVAWYGEDQDTIRWIFVIVDSGVYDGWPGFIFSNQDSTKWKTQEVTRALQGGKETTLSLDLDNPKAVAAFIKKAKRVRGKVENQKNRETDEIRLSLRKVRPLLEEAGKKAADPADDLDDIEDTATDPEDGGDEPYTEEELADMALKDLKEILKDEFEFSAADLRKLKTPDAAREAILEAQDADEDDDDADDADDDFDDDFEDGATEEAEPEPEPEPEPAPRRRRAAAATKAAPAKAAAPAQRTRRARR